MRDQLPQQISGLIERFEKERLFFIQGQDQKPDSSPTLHLI